MQYNDAPIFSEVNGKNLPDFLKINQGRMRKKQTKDEPLTICVLMHHIEDGETKYYQYDEHFSVCLVANINEHSTEQMDAMHSHEYFEIALVIGGELHMQIESRNSKYKVGDVCILNCNTNHREIPCSNHTVAYLCVSTDYILGWPDSENDLMNSKLPLTRFLRKNSEIRAENNKDYLEFIFTGNSSSNNLVQILYEMTEEMEQHKPGYNLILRGLVVRFFSELNNKRKYVPTYTNLGSDSELIVAHDAKRFIDESKRRITRSELSEALHYNGDYISRIFKIHIGLSLKDYCQQVYIKEAVKLLTKTEMSVLEISKRLGFENKTQFYKIFKEFHGTTPDFFRKNHQESLQ